jgi:glycosyltransferase involved in cell wall biosynthesis
MRIGGIVSMPDRWDIAILNRANFILNSMGKEKSDEREWFASIQLIASEKNGNYYVWLAVTGCYPSKYQLKRFISDLHVGGLRYALQKLISERLKDTDSLRMLIHVILIHPKNTQLVDVTHTYSTPFLTGIQRVVRGVTEGVHGISTFIWLGTSGIIIEKEIRKEVELHSNTLKSWRLEAIGRLHKLVPFLDKSQMGKRIRIALLPLARRIKRVLINGEVKYELNSGDTPEIHNILIHNVLITIPEIPEPDHIFYYEAMMENSIIPIQVILYDFIPLFHAWTVHPINRGSLNVYLRIILLADRILSISELVQEQAQLITQAFRLERTDWQNRRQTFDCLPLPSGLVPASFEEFKKDPTLIVMAGSLEPRKNHMQFLDAMEIISKRDIPIKGEILGSAGWENNHILDRIHELQTSGVSIVRLGNLSDEEIRKRIGQAQALLQISEAEGFGLPIAEALALGTKVIVTDVRPFREWISDRVFVVGLEDPVKLADQISEILSEPEKSTGNVQGDSSWEPWIKLLYS